MIRYRLSQNEFLLPLPGRTDRLEILVREPGPAAEFPPLVLSSPVELEPGNVYRRYVADNLLDSKIQGRVAPEPWTFKAEWVGLFLAFLFGAAGVFAYRRRGTIEEGREPVQARDREEIILAIARLDEEFEGEGASEARGPYEAKRRELLSELRRRS